MIQEIEQGPPIYRPSKFWDFFNAKNMEQVCQGGLGNFKKTVNQNYYNWVPESFEDNQLRNLLAFWGQNPSTLPFKTKIEGDPSVENIYKQRFLAAEDSKEIYRLFVGLLWHFARHTDTHNIVDSLCEPVLGNPVRLTLEDKLISQDLANSARERNLVFDYLKPPAAKDRTLGVAELGAGYGRLAYVFLRTTPCRYFIFDIPPALYFSQWYLTSLFPDKRAFRFRAFQKFADVKTEIDNADLGFFTPNQLELFPDDYFDSFVSISSLQEMTKEQIHNYKKLMMKTTRQLIYLKQFIRSGNPFDNIEVTKDEYEFAPPWKKVLDRKDAVQDLFFEAVFTKGA